MYHLLGGLLVEAWARVVVVVVDGDHLAAPVGARAGLAVQLLPARAHPVRGRGLDEREPVEYQVLLTSPGGHIRCR